MLSNIKSKTIGSDNSTVDADIVGPVTNGGNSRASLVAGHISIAITNHEGSTITSWVRFAIWTPLSIPSYEEMMVVGSRAK